MTTTNEIIDNLHDTIEESESDIEKLERCNECMANSIDENVHLISWNRGCIDHAEFTLEEIEKGQQTAIRDVKHAHNQDIRIRLASALHDLTTHWMKVAIKHPDINRDFVDKPFDELAAVDQYAPLRDADTILDILRGE